MSHGVTCQNAEMKTHFSARNENPGGLKVVEGPHLKNIKMTPTFGYELMTTSGSKSQNPNSKTPREAVGGKENHGKSYIVTFWCSLSNRQKNEKPVSHATKMTPKATMKNLITTKQMVQKCVAIFLKA